MNRLQLVTDLTRDEGKRLKAYDDGTGQPIVPGTKLKGHPTIGIGRALDVNGITEVEAQYLLGNDIDTAIRLMQNFPWYESQDDVRQNVLLSMVFNMGLQSLLNFHDLIRYLADARYDLAAKAMEDSLWAREVGARAVRLANEMRTGVFSA